MIVADTNLISYLLIPGQRTREAEIAFERDPAWIAPLLWRSEFRSVLTLSMRRKLLSLEDADQIMEKAETLMKGNEFQPVSAQVLALAARSRCSAYDCEFVALAHELDVKLVTSDEQVLGEFPETAVALECSPPCGEAQ